MLTKDLLVFRRRKDRYYPGFIEPNEGLIDLAQRLTETIEESLESPRGDIEDELSAEANGSKSPKVARGLIKLLLDRCDFEEPDEAARTLRANAFSAAAEALRGLGEDARPEDFEAALRGRLEAPLDTVRTQLFADLPERRRLLSMKPITPERLIARYNLAQVQGLVLFADRVVVSIDGGDVLELRGLLRWLKFCRLVASVEEKDGATILTIEGPASILEMSKKYGLQLANFVMAVPRLSQWALSAEIDYPRRGRGRLELSDASGLSAPPAPSGHIPPEIEQVLEEMTKDSAWTVDHNPKPRHVGARSMCVPDFAVIADERAISVELFHRWHKHPLNRRLDELSTKPDPNLVLGVERALIKKDEALKARVEGHPQVFLFNQFPSRTKLKAALDRQLLQLEKRM